jgi:hypothetical protein
MMWFFLSTSVLLYNLYFLYFGGRVNLLIGSILDEQLYYGHLGYMAYIHLVAKLLQRGHD